MMMGDADDAKDDEGFPPPELTALCVCVCLLVSERTDRRERGVRADELGHRSPQDLKR